MTARPVLFRGRPFSPPARTVVDSDERADPLYGADLCAHRNAVPYLCPAGRPATASVSLSTSTASVGRQLTETELGHAPGEADGAVSRSVFIPDFTPGSAPHRRPRNDERTEILAPDIGGDEESINKPPAAIGGRIHSRDGQPAQLGEQSGCGPMTSPPDPIVSRSDGQP